MTGPVKLWEATYRVVITQLWHLRKLLTVGLAQEGQPLHGGAGSEFTIKQVFLVFTRRFKEPQICWFSTHSIQDSNHGNLPLFSPAVREHAGRLRKITQYK